MITMMTTFIPGFSGLIGQLLSMKFLSVLLPLHLMLFGAYGSSPGAWPTPPIAQAQALETKEESKEVKGPELDPAPDAHHREQLETVRVLEEPLSNPDCRSLCQENLSRNLFPRYLDLANYHGEAGQYAEAEIYFQKAGQALKVVPLKERPALEGRLLQQRALRLKDRGDFEAAERDLQKSLQLLQQSGDTQNYWISKSVSASLAMAQGRYRRSIAIYQEVLKAREKLLGPTDPRLGYVLNNFGEVYRDLRQWDKAEALYLRAQKLWRGESPEQRAAILHNLGAIRREQGRWDEAEALLRQAGELLKAQGPAHNQRIELKISEARLALKRGQLDAAQSQVKEAMQNLSRYPEHPLMIQALKTLAEIHRARSEYDQAEFTYKQAQDALLRAKVVPTHPELIRIQWALAQIAAARSGTEVPKATYLKTLEQWRKAAPEGSWDEVEILRQFSHNPGEAAQAEQYRKRAQELEEAFGSEK